jgi:hypothetical protein
VYQAVDTVYYGYNLADYLHKEFKVDPASWSPIRPPNVRFWGELFFGRHTGG